MTLPIFWRLVLSHVGILLLAGAACSYSIVQLGSLSGTARNALDGNYRMIGYQEGLTDAFLSQVRYGGKYLITHVEGRREQMRQFKQDFNDYLGQLKKLGTSDQIAAALSKSERLHVQYHELFDREVEYIRAKQTYAQSRFQQERDKIVESAITELADLKSLLRTRLHEELEGIERSARTSRHLAILTTLIVLILGTLLSLKMSRELAVGPTAPIDRKIIAWEPAASRGANFVQCAIHWGKRLPLLRPSFITAWNRCSIFWRNSNPRSGE
jgi:CHASE3 domain sensor protein